MSTFSFSDYPEEKAKNENFSFSDYAEHKPSTGFSGIAEDVKESLRGAPSSIVESLRQLPREAYLSGKQAIKHPIRAGENVVAGLLQGLKGAVNIPSVLAQYAGEKDIGLPAMPHYFRDIASPIARKLEIGDTGLQKKILGEEQEGDALLQGLGEFAPYARFGAGAKGLSGLAKRAASAGAFGVGQKQDPLHSALLGLTGEGAVKGIVKGTEGVNKLRPSNLIKSPLSEEGLRKALEITKRTRTGLGEAIENPFLQEQYQNILTKIPFSGANQAMQETATHIKEKGHNILLDFLNDKSIKAKRFAIDSEKNISDEMVTALKEAKKEAETKKRANFKETNERADKIGLSVGRSNFSSAANEALQDINRSPELMRETDRSLITDLNAYSDANQSNNLKLTNIFKSKLGDKASQAFKEGDKHKYSIYRSLKDSLDKDIEDSIENSNDKSLKEKHASDMKFYKENIAPFEDKDVMKYTNKGGDPDMFMNTFLKKSKVSDRANLLKKVQDKLPEDKKNLFAYAYFSKAIEDGEFNPLAFKSLYKALGQNQRKVLLPEKAMREKLKDYSSLVSKNANPLKIMFNPKTGYSELSKIAALVMAVPAIFTGIGTGGSIPATALATLTAPILARGATKYLTSPVRREKLINKMIENKKRPLQMKIDSSRMNEYLRNALQGASTTNNMTDN